MSQRIHIFAAIVALAGFALPASAAPKSDAWASYLDYAYIYSSAEDAALRARLDRYAQEAGRTLDQYLAERLEGGNLGEAEKRRRAIAHLLAYLESGDTARLDASVTAIGELSDRIERHENRYWHHYIHAHRALEEGDSLAFVSRMLRLWQEVVVELEASYATYQTLSLNDSRSAGFVSSLPYLYENVARMVLLRSQRMGIRGGLDPLGALVRFLDDGRVGAYPDVIAPEASSRDYLDAIATRLDGPESDGGSLTFTLALFEASRYHDRARALLADQGFSDATLEATRVAVGGYASALSQATTLQGQCAVYTRVLRQMGEIDATKQRLGVEPEIEIPFSIARAMKIYGALHADRNEGWEKHGYRNHGRDAYVRAMHGLWEEIQEASFNAAESHLARGIQRGAAGNEEIGDAVGTYSRYLTFFERHAEPGEAEAVPPSAYFAAHLAARSIGDATLHFDGGNPSTKQLDNATRQYLRALAAFPFEPVLWSSTAVALERQGRESEYLELTRRIAESVTSSRTIDTWIGADKEAAPRFEALRRALADDLAIMYLGFSNASDVPTLEAGLAELRERREGLALDQAKLQERLDGLERSREDRLARSEPAARIDPLDLDADLPEVAASGPVAPPVDPGEIAALSARIAELGSAQERLDDQIEARVRALPLFKQALESGGLDSELATRRDHAVHALVRRIYFENADPKGDSE